MKLLKSFIVAILLLLVNTSVSAQCTFRNTAFKSGEFLTYNLYYNWKFVWVKAGTASMSADHPQGQACLSWFAGNPR